MSYSENYIYKFMQDNSWHHKSFHFHLSFWIYIVLKGREKITKNWISREQKELFQWNKKHFLCIFWGDIVWWKNKNHRSSWPRKLWKHVCQKCWETSWGNVFHRVHFRIAAKNPFSECLGSSSVVCLLKPHKAAD